MSSTLRIGSSGQQVRDLQQELKLAGFDPGGVDGEFGPKTRAAVVAYQNANRLDADGIVGPKTWARLHSDGFETTPPSGPAPTGHGGSGPLLRQGAGGPAVEALQTRLRDLGFDPGGIDGDFGPHTAQAVRLFQSSHGLDADGVVGPRTWDKLGITVEGPSGPTGPHGPSSGNAFIDSIAQGAMAGQAKWGVPASVTIAQAILESGWGGSSLSRDAHNLFGVKGSGPAGSITLPTREYVNGHWITINAAFRRYHNEAESIDDHDKLLATSHYYTRAMAVKNDPKAFANALTGVYATAPNYGQSLIDIMNRYNLYQYDR